MLELCWYCQTMIDVDEAIEGHAEIHADCLLELCSGGSWAIFIARTDNQRREYERQITRVNKTVEERRALLLSSA